METTDYRADGKEWFHTLKNSAFISTFWVNCFKQYNGEILNTEYSVVKNVNKCTHFGVMALT